ncbi:MAG TPA: cysteine desulfurase family protein [Dictyobacter sp.]|jgi:cysteine desulfurase|nr:cysteine desulfurase family protein [Dictyobacter sp.]
METVLHPGLRNGPIYLDYNATTPVDPAVVDAMLPYLATYFGNPSSSHAYAQQTRQAIQHARAQVAHLLNCEPAEIVFTGSGSESDELAIRGVALARQQRGKHIITQVTEHPAVINVCRSLERLHGFSVTYLPVDEYGQVRLADLEAAITGQTTLITIMHANNETGTIQPIAEIARVAHQHDILLHVDAAQSIGKIPVDVKVLGADLLTVVGHKIYAPKGIAALYVRSGIQLEPLLYGGGQESGRRAGTENIAYMVALGQALELAGEQLVANQQRLTQLRDYLQQQLEQLLPQAVQLNGHPQQRLPNTLSVRIQGVMGDQVLAAIPEIASSTGSACHEGNTDPSSVLLAMGIERNAALGTLRLTLGRWTTRAEIEQAAALIARAVKTLR